MWLIQLYILKITSINKKDISELRVIRYVFLFCVEKLRRIRFISGIDKNLSKNLHICNLQ